MNFRINDYDFCDLEVGMKKTISKKVAYKDIAKFCELTNDFHPLHTNEKYARQCGFNNIIAHGSLITSYTSEIIGMYLPGKKALIATSESHYIAPVYPADLLKIEAEIIGLRKAFSIAFITVDIFNQSGKLVSKINYRVKVRKDG